MAKKLLSVTVRGRRHEWGFNFYGDPAHLEEWRRDGLEIDEIENIIPQWAVSCGLTRVYCFLQDTLNFKNPFD